MIFYSCLVEQYGFKHSDIALAVDDVEPTVRDLTGQAMRIDPTLVDEAGLR